MNMLSNWLKNLCCNTKLEEFIKAKSFELESEIARLKQVEQELQTVISRKRAIFEAEPDATIISNDKGIIVMANKQVECLLGFSPNELIGCSIDMLIPLRFRDNHRKYRERYYAMPNLRLMGNGLPNIVALRKDKTEIDVEISLSRIETQQGDLFASSLRDITVRKKNEEELKTSEERFRLMANSSPIMIWITDREGNPTFSNKAWTEFVGLKSLTAITHDDWLALVHPDDQKLAVKNYYVNTHNLESISTEYRLRHTSGEWRWVFDQGVPMFNDLGIFVGYIGSLVDITDRKNAEAELRIAAIAFESHEAMVVTDANTIILRVNEAFTKLTGYSAEECIGQKMYFLHSGYHNEAFYQTMWNNINADGTWQGEIWDRRKNGEVYPKWLTITAVKNDAGEVTHYVGTQSDITDRKAEDKRMYDLAYYDALTKLPNRRLLEDRMEHSIAIAQRHQKNLAVLMLDLDKFKAVNDNLGHLAGDKLLQLVALRISKCLRESDTVARLGGDEFVVLLEHITDTKDAALVAENIVNELSKSFHLAQNHDVQIGTSIGISLYPQDGDTSTTLIANADVALYQAKHSGRGRFVYFSQE
ncbi:MAG: PAS domain S-box protein [Methylococcales bacterium]|nr:PAS domain S-box protein [Methylococcales bacterium]